jgi:hypothetical protein
MQRLVRRVVVLLDWQATSTPIWFKIVRVMSFPVVVSTKPIGVVEVARGLPALLNELNGAQPVPLLAHTSIGWTAT